MQNSKIFLLASLGLGLAFAVGDRLQLVELVDQHPPG